MVSPQNHFHPFVSPSAAEVQEYSKNTMRKRGYRTTQESKGYINS
jgi:hypothetical protein